MRKEEGYTMSRCSQSKAAWSLDFLPRAGKSKKRALLAHSFPLSTRLVEIRVLLDLQCLWKWCCDCLHGETLSHTLAGCLPAGGPVLRFTWALLQAALLPVQPPLVTPWAPMGSSSITSRGIDLLTYARGNVTLFLSFYEIVASCSLWVNRGVVVINPSTGNLIRII